ncbi:G-type lectin S-receptor serine/threonine-protein kinase [Trifolium repens]|nr:G-type lectin S-receptor serine/threonine-protein kinase [Trifolium repens]
MSTMLSNQIRQPLPPSLISKFAYAAQEQFFRHTVLHSSRLKLLLNHDDDVSGNFMLVYFKNSSPWEQFNCVFLTQPSDQFDEFHFVSDFGTKPFKHLHFGSSVILQLELIPHKA